MQRLVFLICGAMLLVSSGCNTVPNLPASSDILSDEDSYFVIGVAPEGTLVDVRSGIIQNGKFSSRPTYEFDGASYLNHVQDGFIVGKAGHHREPFAILGVGTRNATAFAPCRGAQTMVFTVPPGKIVYVGSVSYTFPTKRNEHLSASYSDDIAAARDYLKSHYPRLADKLEHGSVQMLPTDESCSEFE